MEASDQRETILPNHERPASEIDKNLDVLLRCTDVNVYVISCLRSEGVLDIVQESQLDERKNRYERAILLYKWLKECNDVVKYKDFLRVMEHKDVGQQHVANLLKGNSQGKLLPLSETRYTRLVKIRPKLVEAVSGLEVDTEFLNAVKASRAISNTDYDEISAQKGNCSKSYYLVNAIMRRSNESFDLFKQSLLETKRHHMAAYLDEGEMPKVHINTTRPDLDGDLSYAFNKAINDKSNLLSGLNGMNLHPIVARPGHSIEVLIYCRKMKDVEMFVETFNSKHLEEILCSILNELLLKIEPENTDGLKAKISIDEEEAIVLEEITATDYYLELTTSRAKVVHNLAVQCGQDDFLGISFKEATKFDLVEAFARFIEAVTESMEKLNIFAKSITTEVAFALCLGELKETLSGWNEEKDMNLLVHEIESATTEMTRLCEQLKTGDYEEDPTHEDALPLFQSVVEIAILKDELHVVHKCSSLVNTFDCLNYKCKGQNLLREISDPRSITSCSLNECIYIMNYSESRLLMEILKFDSSLTKLVTRWEIPVESCQPSVCNGNIVIPYVDGPSASIAEYKSDGTKICDIKVSQTVHAHSLWRAAKIGSNQYVGIADCIATLVLIDDTGKVQEKKRLEQFEDFHSTCSEESKPKNLKIESEGNILVGVGHIIYVISPDLKSEQQLIIERRRKQIRSTNICFDESNGTLYVVDKDTGRLQIFTIRGSSEILRRSRIKLLLEQLQTSQKKFKLKKKLAGEAIEKELKSTPESIQTESDKLTE